ncbi:MAG: FG-GAP-like repeat-containing protein, partial [bacterium]
AYIFYNDGSMPTTASTADISIAGEVANDFFTQSLTAGDFNNDGKTDLVVGAPGSGTNMGRAYIFYNDGSMPTTASTADIIITGQNASDNFGVAMLVSDFNNDNRPDLVVGANGFNLSAGRIYIFNNDGSMPTTASTADQIVTGEVMNSAFGSALTVGDFNANGKKDLAVGASMYGISTGRVYVFEQISALPAVASSAEIIITGETNSNFGEVIASADLDSDNKIDLVASAPGLNSNTGAIYIFYNNQTLTQTASTADVIIKGENTGDAFGQMLGALDLNSDKKLDLITSAYLGSGDGRVYGFYSNNGFMDSGSTLSLNKSNEVIAPYFGGTIVSADFNNDGKVDLAVSANNAITYYDVVYIFYSDGSLPSTSDQADLKITSEDDKGRFGYAMITGDLNNDGRVDLIVGDYLVSSSMGKVYVFYNDGSMPTSAANADLIITGEANSYFGEAMTMCDMNADGKLDLIVGATMYNAYQGAVYIFYNDGIIPSLAMNADKNILGGAAGEAFGYVIVALDLNNDGQNDLAVGATSYNSSMGRVYVFYNDGNLPATGAAADIIINGQATGDNFGYSLAVGDFNNDGKTDLVVGAYRSLSNGAVYIFYNDGSIPGSAGSAELIITDNVNSWFGYTLLAGDFNNDGKTDLAVSGQYYSTYTGHVYIFYNDGSMPTSAANADVIISGETTNTQFGWTMFQADFNFDGKPDLVIGGPNYGASLGAVYVFYNDGSLTSTAANADKKIIGAHNLNERFGYSMLLADINKDGLTDLIVGAPYYLNIGRVYIFYGTLDKSTEPDVKIDGNALGFGSSLTLGDFNGDGWSDLAVGSPNISSNMGQVLVFYNDGSMPLTAQTADVVFSGVGITNYFGYAMTSTDLNSDGRDDLVVGAYRKSNGTVYIFNGGSFVSTTSAGASTTITNSIAGYFGYAITKGDFNADGKMDLVISDYRYNTYQGVVYVLYNDGTIPTTTIKVDKRIYGTSSSDFGIALTMGDVNGDKTDDLIVGASRNAGQVFAYYVTGAMATNTSVADLRIVNTYGLTNFGCSLVVADYNNDGKNDLVIGDSGYKANAGRAYVFYNKPIMATSTLAADVVLTNHTTGNFADSMSSGDLNNDGRVDLVIGAFGDNSIYYYISKYIAPTHSIRGSFKSWGNVKLW